MSENPFANPFSAPGSEHFGPKQEATPTNLFIKPKPPAGFIGGGGHGSIRKRQEQEAAEKEQAHQNEIEEWKKEQARKKAQEEPERILDVKVFNLKWNKEGGVILGNVIASFEAEVPKHKSIMTRIFFTLYSGRDRLSSKNGHLRNGKAEVEFFLPRPGKEEGVIREDGTHYHFTAKHLDSKLEKSPELIAVEPVCQDAPDPAPMAEIGKCHYYVWRHDNFKERHKACYQKPPEYYLGYGYKYCERFTTDTYPKLSDKGKVWLKDAKHLLQKYLENELKNNLAIELEGGKFKSLAIKTHKSAYINAGITALPIIDLIIIGFTPDIKEWLDKGSRAQAKDISGKIVEVWRIEFEAAMKCRVKEVTDYFKNILPGE